MTIASEGSKSKTARRVIEVLEFFDDQNRRATVSDIARRYKRPQSSTSELLASLVEMGLLYKDMGSRSYAPTPRAAILGSSLQPSLVRDGRLFALIDRLSAQTGLGVMLLGLVGLNAQVFRWSAGARGAPHDPGDLGSGAQERLCDSVAGWLLLSTIAMDRRNGMIRRLNAEAEAERKFNYPEMLNQVQACGEQGYAIGAVGFASTAETVAVPLPSPACIGPMVLGFVYDPAETVDRSALVTLLETSIRKCVEATAYEDISAVSTAA